MAYIPNDARWYLADVVIEHIIDDDPRNVVHTNMHLIEASSPEQVYEKALALGRDAELTYESTDGKQVRVKFRGMRDLNVIHDELEDGAELSYAESVGVLETELLARLRSKEELGVFLPRRAKLDGPNYMPESVQRMLENERFTREDLEHGE
jgi:hypothetical protein